MGRKAACGAALLAALLLAACATKLHPYELDESDIGAPGVGRVALLPLNVVHPLPPELDSATRRVTGRVREHLRACGIEIAHVGLSTARRLWAEAAGPGPEPAVDSYAEQAQSFVERLGRTKRFDAVVVPSLVYREGRIRPVTREVEFDGVSRTLEVVGHVHTGRGFYWMGDFAGRMPAVSLYLEVYDPAGRRVFEIYGGLDLVHEADIRGAAELDGRWQMRLKKHALSDEAALREGVAMAFWPYLVPETPPAAATHAAP